jgi:cytochrome c oxidase subunit 1
VLVDWLSSTGHKVIGHLYLITSFGFFMIAGLMAMIMRAQLMGPDNHLVSDQQYNELFTMHGAIMLLLFAAPLFVAEVPDRRADADDGRVGDQAAMAAPP